MSLNQKFKLATGQTLGYLETGSPDGEACFYFHGFPGSSRQVLILEDQDVLAKFRIISVDRPGFGESSFSKSRKIVEIADLVGELAGFLKIGKFHLIGVSGGLPSAFVVADRLRSKVLSLTGICGLGPLSEKEFFQSLNPKGQLALKMARTSPFLAAQFLASAHGRLQKGGTPRRDVLLKWLPPEDVELIMNEELRERFRESMRHAFAQGAAGPALEMKAIQQDWGIRDWSFPFPVRLWHGLRDTIVPPDHSRKLAARIPGAELHLLEEGHYSLPILRAGEILKPLMKS